MMRVLATDYTARGHALLDACTRSREFERAFLAPGNAQSNPNVINTGIDPSDFDAVFKLVNDQSIDLTLVNQDSLLAEGIVDAFRQEFKGANHKIFGPTLEAAKIESSKDFMKWLTRDLNIPVADSSTYGTEMGVITETRRRGYPVVVKADMLAAGKGVKVCINREDVLDHLVDLRKLGVFGERGQFVLVEEYLEGPEISLHAWCDGDSYKMFPFAMQNYKNLSDEPGSPMTGGTGVVIPIPGFTPELIDELGQQFVAPVLKFLNGANTPFQGVIYPELILTKDGPKLLEYNARPGAPETEAWAPLFESDLIKTAMACEAGRLAGFGEIKWANLASVCVVLMAEGYSGVPRSGEQITGFNELDEFKDLHVFHGGTRREGDKVLTNGGRVLSLTTVGKADEDVGSVVERAYLPTEHILFNGEYPQARIDIGRIAISQIMSDRVAIARESLRI